MAKAVAELNPCDGLGEAFLAIAFAPFLLHRHHQLERHDQAGLAAEAAIGAFCSVPDGGEDALDRI